MSAPNIADSVTIFEMKRGDSAIITALENPDKKTMLKLSAFGVLPGVKITLLQTKPVFVLLIDNTQLAFDREIARTIRVAKI